MVKVFRSAMCIETVDKDYALFMLYQARTPKQCHCNC